MNEITRIHIAKISYDIEVDAKKELEKYLEMLASISDDAEMSGDIEIRMTEILTERGIMRDGVITSTDVDALMKQLGEPQEFMDEDAPSGVATAKAISKHKLFRSNDQAVLGGVLGGIAEYYGINPLWTRLIFIVLAFISFGFAFIVYVILWIALPPVKTVADKLQLRGEPVTVNSMRQLATEEGPIDRSHDTRIIRVLTILVGSGFTFAALIALAGTVTGVIGILWRGSHLDPHIYLADHLVLGYWMLGLAAAGGLLLTALCSLAAYACFSRRITRRILISGALIVVAGLGCVGAFGAIGFQVSQLNQAEISRNTTVSDLIISGDQSQATNVVVDGDQGGVVVTYQVSDQPLKATFKSWHSQESQKPRLNLKDGVLYVDVPKQQGMAWYIQPELTIYGPALDKISLQKATNSVEYDGATQNKLLADVGSGELTLRGQIDQIATAVSENGVLDASSASVQTVKADVGNGAQLVLGTIKSLDLTTREVCATGQQVTRVNINALTDSHITVNGKNSNAASFQTACTNVTIEDSASASNYRGAEGFHD